MWIFIESKTIVIFRISQDLSHVSCHIEFVRWDFINEIREKQTFIALGRLPSE